MKRLFISWAGSHAKEISGLIRSFFEPYSDQIQVFFSDRDIAQGNNWRKDLISMLNKSNDSLIIFSQEAQNSEWFLYESAVLSARLKNFNMFLLGAPTEMIPAPLEIHQHKILDRFTMKEFIDKITKSIGVEVNLKDRDDLLNNIHQIATKYENLHVTHKHLRWRDASYRPLAIYKQNNSPYDLQELIRIAQNKLILIAQNHRFMTERSPARQAIWHEILKKIMQGLEVEIIAMHPSASLDGSLGAESCRVWEKYMGSPHFFSHLKDCWDTLFDWWEDYSRVSKKIGSLSIIGAYFLPISLNIVDPESDDGLIVVSPRMAQEANPNRPQFVITKKYESKIFEFYWHTIINSASNASWRNISDLARLS